jgi:hypothetical protein
MSDSSLSLPPMSEPSLPILPLGPQSPPRLRPFQLRRTTSQPQLPKSDSPLFKDSLFSRTLLDTIPPMIQLKCMQPTCDYSPKPYPIDYSITSNYWTHYKNVHPEIAILYNQNMSRSSQSSQKRNPASFFTPRLSKPIASTAEAFQMKYRALLLDFMVSNNLALRVVDSQSHCRLIQHCNASILSIGKSTLIQDLDKTFILAQSALKVELQEHIKVGGRISITTDAWTASNEKEFIAVTGHWINKDWKQRSQLLDIVHLTDPIHCGEYLVEQLLSVTNDFNITKYIFTITRDNTSPNDSMLNQFEETVTEQRHEKPENLQQPWSFT